MYDPAQLVGRPLPVALDELLKLGAEELWPQGEVELHQAATSAGDAVTCRPAQMLATTVADVDIPATHPDVTIPGVSLAQFLGGGGQGWVYAGKVLETGKTVAVKILRSDYVLAKGWAAREALICTRVRHPNILRVFDTQQAGNFWVVLMEMIAGDTLAETSLSLDHLRRCLVDIADALIALEKGRIVHCDVKPNNILLRRQSGIPVLVDFGIAHDLNEPEENDALYGTPFYLAPEAFRTRQPNFAWDAYALGVTAASALGYQRHYGSMKALQTDKLSGSFDKDLAFAMERLQDAGLRRWVLSLIHTNPDARLEALASASRWLAA